MEVEPMDFADTGETAADINPLIVKLLMNYSGPVKLSMQDLNTFRQVSPNTYNIINEDYWNRKNLCFQIIEDSTLNQYMGFGNAELKKNWNFHHIYRKCNTNNLTYALRTFDWVEIRKQVQLIAPPVLHLQIALAEMCQLDPYQLTLPMHKFQSVKKLSMEFKGYRNDDIGFTNQLELFKQIYENVPNTIEILELIMGDDEANIHIQKVLEFVATNTNMTQVQITLATNLRAFQLEQLNFESFIQSLPRKMEVQLNFIVAFCHLNNNAFYEFFKKYAHIILQLTIISGEALLTGQQAFSFDFSNYEWTILENLILWNWRSSLTLLSCFPKLKTLELHCTVWEKCGITKFIDDFNFEVEFDIEDEAYGLEVLDNLKKVFPKNLPIKKLFIENYPQQEAKMPKVMKSYLESLYDVKYSIYKNLY